MGRMALTPGPSPVRGRGVPEGRGEGKPTTRIKQAARDLRKSATESERILWRALRDRKLAG